MFRSKTILALALPLALATASAAAAAEFVGRATVQIRAEHGYDALAMSRVLTDAAYLGSVMPGMFPFHSHDGVELDATQTMVKSEPVGIEMLTIDVRGPDETAVRGHLRALIDNLTSIVPSGRADALQGVATAEKSLDLATMEYDKMRGRLTEFVEKNGAVEPTTWLNTLRNSLQQRAMELERLDLDVASQRALRDYLVEVIAATPASVTLDPSPEIREAEAELRKIAASLEVLQQIKTETHPDIRKLRERLVDETARLDGLRAAQGGTISNPRRARLEGELFDIERELTLNESRRRGLNGYVDQMRVEAKRLALVESEWRDLREQLQMAESRLFNSRSQLDSAQTQARRALASEWAAVIAGPTFAEE